MQELKEFGDILFYRFVASKVLPVSWFRRTDPATVAKAKRRGRLRLQIVSHCWHYSHFLTYQLSSLVLHQSARLDLTVTVYYCPEDESTLRVLRFFGEMKCPGIAWDWRALPKEQLLRRGIGRNLAAKSTTADWVWFTDADIVFQDKCLDTLADLLQGRDDALLYPAMKRATRLLPEDDDILSRGRGGPAIINLPLQAFPLHLGPASRATGPCQITHGDIARECGYCDGVRVFQRPAPRWRKTYDDAAFRWVIGSRGVPIDLPGVCQIRHSAKGRYRQGAFSSVLRASVRKLQDHRR